MIGIEMENGEMINYPCKWISVRLGRLELTKNPCWSIFDIHVRNQNRSGFKACTTSAWIKIKRSQPRDRHSLFNPSYMVREQATKRYFEGSSSCGLSKTDTSRTPIRSTRLPGTKNEQRNTPANGRRVFQREIRDYREEA